MQTDETLWPLGSTTDLRNRQRRRVAREDRRWLTNRIQCRKQLPLRRKLFDNRLDDDVRIFEVFDLRCSLEPSADFTHHRFGDCALLRQAIQVFLDALEPLVQ